MKKSIVSDRWYTVRMEVQPDKVDCYLDGELLMSYTEPDKIFAISGRDTAGGDILIKIVNAAGVSCRTHVSVGEPALAGAEARLTTLAAAGEGAENSFEHPIAYLPVTTSIPASNGFDLELQPFSINVLRLRDTRWRK